MWTCDSVALDIEGNRIPFLFSRNDYSALAARASVHSCTCIWFNFSPCKDKIISEYLFSITKPTLLKI